VDLGKLFVDLSEACLWVLNLSAAVRRRGWFAFRWMHALIEDTPTSRVPGGAGVELEGPGIAGTSISPLTQRDALVALRVQRPNLQAGAAGASANRGERPVSRPF
jgi:hypothetical protein